MEYKEFHEGKVDPFTLRTRPRVCRLGARIVTGGVERHSEGNQGPRQTLIITIRSSTGFGTSPGDTMVEG